jgi:hypothetical protein
MYKLAMVDLSDLSDRTDRTGLSDLTDGEAAPPDLPEAVFTLRNFSGGVFQPVMVEEALYYRGSFSAWDALLRYPEAGTALTGPRFPVSFRPWTAADLAVAGVPSGQVPGGFIPAATTAAGDSAATAGTPAAIGGTGAEPAPRDPTGEGAVESKRYFSLPYLNPFRLWLPLPLVRITNSGLSFDGGGLFSFISDPIDTNLIFLFAYMDARSLMAAANLQWINLSLGFPLNITFSDDIDKTQHIPYRETQGTIAGTLEFGLGNERRRLKLNPGLGFSLAAADRGDGSSAYTWEYGEPYYHAMLGIGVSNLRRFNWELFGQGAALTLYGRVPLARPLTPRFDGVIETAFEPYLPLKLSLYGAWDENGMNLYGNSRYYTTTPFNSIASVEYPSAGMSALSWLGGGEAELRLFSLDFQKNLSHLYINRFFGTLAYRGVVYDDQGVPAAEGTHLGGSLRLGQSLILRLGATVSTILITALPIRISAWVWGAWKMPNMRDRKNNDFVIGPGFSISY